MGGVAEPTANEALVNGWGGFATAPLSVAYQLKTWSSSWSDTSKVTLCGGTGSFLK